MYILTDQMLEDVGTEEELEDEGFEDAGLDPTVDMLDLLSDPASVTTSSAHSPSPTSLQLEHNTMSSGPTAVASSRASADPLTILPETLSTVTPGSSAAPAMAPAASVQQLLHHSQRGVSRDAVGMPVSGQSRLPLDVDQEQWCNPEEPDVEPPLPKFEPKHPSGPRIERTAAWSPLSLFKLFFSSSTIHTIINNTNDNAARRKDIAVINSYILFKLLAIGRGEIPMSRKRFREVFMKEMVDDAQAAVAAAAPRPTLSTTCTVPMYFGQTATDQRRVCVVCKDQGRKVKTPVYCSKCDVALCFTSSRNCYKDYHLRM
ncbi:piggyBac transposable element-derived protein 4-like [Scomber scombrus]|uniref:PiggyBac transposable element-derived protein 4-like n=1 Tax=Scomber scombrus TaxID=13677 RepID=A0AAV1PBS6_SCOSC